jgi:hypothetical protein
LSVAVLLAAPWPPQAESKTITANQKKFANLVFMTSLHQADPAIPFAPRWM